MKASNTTTEAADDALDRAEIKFQIEAEKRMRETRAKATTEIDKAATATKDQPLNPDG